MTIRFGNAPCSWGTIEGFGSAIPFGTMLDELVAAGYTGTELGDYGFMPTDPEALRDQLSRRGLTMLGAYEGVNLRNPGAHADGEARVLRVARLLAGVADLGDPGWSPLLVLADEHSRDEARRERAGRITPDLSLSEAEWETFARGAEHIARTVLNETGLRTVFHHHCGGFVETPDEIQALMDLTDPALLGLVFDTGHHLYGTGGSDPQAVLDGLERFRERIRYIHFKDLSPQVAARARTEGLSYQGAVGAGVFCELGRGAVPFPAVYDTLRAWGYAGWVTVEQDVLPGLGQPRESAARNRAYLQAIEDAAHV